MLERQLRPRANAGFLQFLALVLPPLKAKIGLFDDSGLAKAPSRSPRAAPPACHTFSRPSIARRWSKLFSTVFFSRTA